jgi:hypothetical protein
MIRSLLCLSLIVAALFADSQKAPLPALTAPSGSGLACTPPRGWVADSKSDEKALRRLADALVSSGLRDAGYTYILLDDGGPGEQSTEGPRHLNARFPNKEALESYLHSKGLKLGLMSAPGRRACDGFPEALKHGDREPPTSPDRPGLYDSNLVPIDIGSSTETARLRTEITLRAILAAPVFVRGRIDKMPPPVREMLSHPEVIAIHNDPLRRQGYREWQDGHREVWVRRLASGDWAVALVNRGTAPARVSVTWGELKLYGSLPVRDVWARRNLGQFVDAYTAEVPAGGAVLLKVMK